MENDSINHPMTMGRLKARVLLSAYGLAILAGTAGLLWVFNQPNIALKVSIVLYLIPLVPATLITIAAYRRHKDERSGWMEQKTKEAGAQLSAHTENTGLLASWVLNAFTYLGIVIIAPIGLLYVVLMFRYKSRLIITTNLLAIWELVVVALGYWLQISGAPYISIAVCALTGVNVLGETMISFSRKKGILALTRSKTATAPSRVLVNTFILMACFACLHFDISQRSSAAYSKGLDIFDSIYFSIVTIATVGYGDIVPISRGAKMLCCAEIIGGVLMLVIAVNANMSVWLQRHQEVVPAVAPSEKAGEGSPHA